MKVGLQNATVSKFRKPLAADPELRRDVQQSRESLSQRPAQDGRNWRAKVHAQQQSRNKKGYPAYPVFEFWVTQEGKKLRLVGWTRQEYLDKTLVEQIGAELAEIVNRQIRRL